MDDVLVDSRDFIRHVLRRRGLLILAVVSALPVAWLRNQQLLNDKKVLHFEAAMSALAVVALAFRVVAKYGFKSRSGQARPPQM